ALLEALSPNDRAKVVPRLAELDPPHAIRILHKLVHRPRAVVPARPAQASPTPLPSAPDSSTMTRAPLAAVKGTTPSEADLQLLVTAQRLVRGAAGLVITTELCLHLRDVQADLYAIVAELRRGATVTTPRLARRPSAARLLVEAEALVLRAAQRLSYLS